MNKRRKAISVLVCMLAGLYASAQDVVTEVEKTDVMRSSGKIYVVMAVVLTIMIGLFAYVFSLDSKLSKLEKK